MLTKLQAIFVAPVVGLALLDVRESRRGLRVLTPLVRAGGAAVLTAGLVLAPMVAAGAWANFRQAMASFSRHDMLSGQVHENHFFMIVPLLALTAAALPEWRALFWVLNGIFALNLYLFYGLGERVGFAIPRSVTIIDATVWLSLANLIVFVWFGRKMAATLRGGGNPPTSAP